MNKVKTHWEARWKNYDKGFGSYGEARIQAFEGINAQADCKVFAMQQALENGKVNTGDSYTKVHVYQVETHESLDFTYSRDTVIEQLTAQARPEQ